MDIVDNSLGPYLDGEKFSEKFRAMCFQPVTLDALLEDQPKPPRDCLRNVCRLTDHYGRNARHVYSVGEMVKDIWRLGVGDCSVR